jgi:YXWGXW repeat-containing protein
LHYSWHEDCLNVISLLNKEKKMTAIKSILFSVVLLFTLSSISTAQLVVVKKPNRPRVMVVKTAKPRKNHVWIDGHWNANGSKYVWVKGR